jgi:glycosyltransferase involved in cell wall biosynthesis
LYLIFTPTLLTKDLLINKNIFQKDKIFLLRDPIIEINKINQLKRQNINDLPKNTRYVLSIGRLTKQKNFSFLIKSFSQIREKIKDIKLIIIGSGSQEKYLKKIANSNIEFVEYSDPSVVYGYVSKAKAFIHAGIEDFGIAPVEALACGTPVIAIKKGGLKETVIENKTGVFFETQNEDAILKAINRFNKIDFDYEFIRNSSLKYSVLNFESKIKEFVNSKTKNGKH